MSTTGDALPMPGSVPRPNTVPLRQRIWAIQVFIDLINKAIGFVGTLNGKSFTKGAAISLSYFLTVFPVYAWIYYFFNYGIILISIPLFTMFLSGILSVRATKLIGIT